MTPRSSIHWCARLPWLANGLLLVACNPPSPMDGQGSGGSSTGVGTISASGAVDTSSSTGGAVTSTGPDSTEEGGSFVGTDFPGEPGECRFGDDSCPAGEKCVPRTTVDDGAVYNVCAPVVRDPVPYGGSCSRYPTAPDMPVDDCDADTYCLVTDADLQTGTCMELCGIEEGLAGPSPDPSVCERTQTCGQFGPVIHVCFDECDALMQDCIDGWGCYALEDATACVPTVGGVPVGNDCTFANACSAGAMCVPGDATPECASAGCCAPWCDTTVPDECPILLPGTACLPYWTVDVPPGLETLGVCAAPP
ncbi:MAG: hypothetical protein AB1Z98_27060 [Nannocystaceae bacterium]